MVRVFDERGITAKGKLIPRERIALFGEYHFEPGERIAIKDGKERDYIRVAEQALAEPIPVLPLSLYREFDTNGNRTRFEEVCFSRRRKMFALTVAEAFERKGRFTEKLLDYLYATLEETTWVLPAHNRHDPVHLADGFPNIYGGNYTQNIDLFSAMAGAEVAMAYYLHREAILAVSPAFAERIEYEISERIYKPFLLRRNFWMGGLSQQAPNNWTVWIITNILTALAVTDTPEYLREKIVDKALVCMDNLTETYPRDGGCDEGASYWHNAGGAYFSCLELLYALSGGAIDVFDHPFVRAMGEYPVKMNIDGVISVNFADCAPRVSIASPLIYRFGQAVGSEIMCEASASALAKQRAELALRSADLPMPSYSDKPFTTLKSLLMPYPESKGTFSHPRAVVYPDLGVMVLRESESGGEGLVLAAKGGHNGESHNHNDVGTVSVYDGGKPLLIDAGTQTYTAATFNPKTRYTLWHTRSCYHNLPSFGGFEQSAGRDFAASGEVFDEAGRSFSLEIAGAYPKEAGIISCRRTSTLGEGCVTVRDAVRLQRECEAVWSFMAADEPSIES